MTSMRAMSFGHGGPHGDGGGFGTGGQAPDWNALAEENARAKRRRTVLWTAFGVVATGLVAAIVATVVVTVNKDDGTKSDAAHKSLPPTATLPSPSTSASPRFSSVAPRPVPSPSEYLNSAARDTAPLTAAGLFPGGELRLDGGTYKKGPLAATGDCAAAAQGALGGVLKANGCRQLLRATYTRGGVAVTVGVAVFDSAGAAAKAKEQARGNVASLPGSGVPVFCRTTVCRSTTNAFARYVYLTVGGFRDGKAVTKADTEVFRAGDELSTYTFRQIYARGVAAASKAAASPAP
ncbi:conserved hypothetical protein [Streptomyces sp. SPB78]|nr:conserved hypothetical protein [Streptomyces sp. SPB78]